MSTVTGQPRYLSLLVAERIIEVLNESGASEAEKHVALEVAKAMVPVLPNASCSAEANDPT
jgi:hypothetical protein